ncbi:hypothetical protein NVI2019_PEGOAJLN_00825 [Providencia alcalifaciens]|uniref:hypothetical protein n=1 Tax=Providencia alcalifaciens TaxID=126385 RepID=UPI000453B107|nr:hypothetical protein [Providencia alcalifaciens]ETT06963.1 hypothetical protein HMPREF1562_2244 [Providencia alcalifaciens F90-2004]MTB34202.1 hypothetical protein [Providencia alcalifaciens]MTC39853.1 hypothetical protein [Providencia alcalifaciens]MTC99469.1 hypothetical protein [Providencia alcalifaciens]CAG9412181.1 hypothetical protein NVI2019_NGLDDFDA_00818 [Providencia alcalifaciens]
MRKYTPFIPALVVILYSLIAFFDNTAGSFIAVLILNTVISFYAFWLLMNYLPFLGSQTKHYQLDGFPLSLVPMDNTVYRYANALNLLALFTLTLIGQWFLVPLFTCLGCWQHLVRQLTLNAISQEK